ncbi:MAG TPA: sugar phosphate isomerase/epimerase [Fimbriimonas sp.]
MKKIPIALQLYSVRDVCPDDFLGVIEKVARMGYEGVEFAGYHGYSPADIKKVLDDNGLKAEGTHTALNLLDDANIQATIDLHKTLDCPWVIVPWIPEDMHNSEDACKRTGERFYKIMEKLGPAGLRTGFHAHSGDMQVLPNGKTAWDVLAESTPPSFIMQYDTANGMQGGADPVQPILDWPGRNQSTHLKEWSGSHGAIIGEGDIPWQRVFDACETVGGTEWYVVEHEENTEMGSLAAVEKCLTNLRAMGK